MNLDELRQRKAKLKLHIAIGARAMVDQLKVRYRRKRYKLDKLIRRGERAKARL